MAYLLRCSNQFVRRIFPAGNYPLQATVSRVRNDDRRLETIMTVCRWRCFAASVRWPYATP
jgi:hypothetical protein